MNEERQEIYQGLRRRVGHLAQIARYKGMGVPEEFTIEIRESVPLREHALPSGYTAYEVRQDRPFLTAIAIIDDETGESAILAIGEGSNLRDAAYQLEARVNVLYKEAQAHVN
jgi:hypothetical protein